MEILLKDLMEGSFTSDGVKIKAKDFEYNKLLTLLIAKHNVELRDIKKYNY